MTSLFRLHLATLLFGLAGVIVRAVPLDVLSVVEYRASLAAMTILIWAGIRRISLRISSGLCGYYLILGLLLAAHWYSFFLSIRLTSVAIGLLAYSCYPIFNLLAAAASRRQLPHKKEVIRLLSLFFGLMILLLPQWQASDLKLSGVGMGLLSGLLFSAIQFTNHKLVHDENAVKISFYQNGIAALALLPFIPMESVPLDSAAIFSIVLLGIGCTAIAHTVFITGMQGVANRIVSLFAYLEPVYGIALAALLLGEFPSVMVLVGGAIILTSFAFEKK